MRHECVQIDKGDRVKKEKPIWRCSLHLREEIKSGSEMAPGCGCRGPLWELSALWSRNCFVGIFETIGPMTKLPFINENVNLLINKTAKWMSTLHQQSVDFHHTREFCVESQAWGAWAFKASVPSGMSVIRGLIPLESHISIWKAPETLNILHVSVACDTPSTECFGLPWAWDWLSLLCPTIMRAAASGLAATPLHCLCGKNSVCGKVNHQFPLRWHYGSLSLVDWDHQCAEYSSLGSSGIWVAFTFRKPFFWWYVRKTKNRKQDMFVCSRHHSARAGSKLRKKNGLI